MMNTIKKYFNLEFNVKNVKAQFSMVQHKKSTHCTKRNCARQRQGWREG